MEERMTFRLTREQMNYLIAEAFKQSSPQKLVKPHEVLRDLIDAAIENSQLELQKAA